MSNLKESKAFYIVISIVIALSMWFYVINEVSPDTKDTIRNIPVTVTGTELLSSRDLVMTAQNLSDIDLKVEGNRKSLMKLTSNTITVTADASTITAAGEYELRCSISLPGSVGAGTVTVKGRDSYRVRVTVEERVSKTVEIKGLFAGSLETGYRAGEFLFSPSCLEVSGPASQIAELDYARVTLSETGLSSTYSGMLPAECIDRNGSKMNTKYLEFTPTEIYTVYPVDRIREIPVRVKVTPGGGAAETDIAYTIFPETIRISGPDSELSKLTELVAGTIDLAKVGASERLVFPVQLPDSVRNESGETEIVVTVRVNGLAVKTLEVTRFELANVPEGYHAELMVDSLRVAVRGTQKAVEAVTSGKLKAVADLSGITAGGVSKAPVTVSLDGVEEAGVLDEGYTVLVNLTKTGE